MTRQAFEKSRLASTIDPNHGNLLTTSYQAGHATKNRFICTVVHWPYFRQLPDLGHIITGTRRLGEFELNNFLFGRDFNPLNLFELLDPRLYLGGV